MVGRDDDVLRLSTQLTASRFVTIVGAGGVGKTTVAVAVGHHLIEAFAGAVLFVDLGMLSDPEPGGHGRRLHAGAVGSVRRCDAEPDRLSARQANSADPRYLRASHRGGGRAGGTHLRWPRRRSTSWRRAARRFRSRASTSTGWIRSPVRRTIRGSRRRPLRRFPRPSCSWSARWRAAPAWTSAMRKPPSSSSICRKLDGVALAIELAARRVESYGLQQTAALLDQRLTLLWLGSRTAPPRQKTLQATLDWSYGLLSELERAGASPARRVRRTFHARCGAGSRDERDPRSSARLRRHRQPRRQVDGRDPPDRGDDALPASRHDARLRPRNQHRRRRARRFGGAPRDLLSAMAGADRDRMVDLVDRDGTGAALRRSQQCPRGSGMVLRRQTAMSRSASDLPPPPRRSSWRCRCCPNVIAGRSARFSLSTMPRAADARRCIFRRRSACR